MSNIQRSKKYFVTGIDTNVGKTILSAILVEALQADYWKPIQSGDLHQSDSARVKDLISNGKSKFHPNTYAFKTPASPHYAARLENIEIDLGKFKVPATDNHLIVEGAGGLLVPLNKENLLIDLIQQLELEVILVAKNYLGSINHTLLTIEALKARKIKTRGIIFNGEINAASEDYILEYTQTSFLGRVLQHNSMDKSIIRQYAPQFEFLKND